MRRKLVVAFMLLVAVALLAASAFVWRGRRSPPSQAGPITSLAVSPDGTYLVSIARRRDVLLARIDASARQPFEAVARHTAKFDVSYAAVSSGASVVVLGGGPVVLWSPRENHVAEPTVQTGPMAVANSPDGTRVALGEAYQGSRLFVLDAQTGRECVRAPAETRQEYALVLAASFAPDGRRLLAGGSFGVQLRDAATLDVVRRFLPSVSCDFLAFDASAALFVCSTSGYSGARDCRSGAWLWMHDEPLTCVSQVHGDLIVRCDEKGAAEVIHMKTGVVVNAARLPDRKDRTAVTALELNGQLAFIEGTSQGAIYLETP